MHGQGVCVVRVVAQWQSSVKVHLRTSEFVPPTPTRFLHVHIHTTAYLVAGGSMGSGEFLPNQAQQGANHSGIMGA